MERRFKALLKFVSFFFFVSLLTTSVGFSTEEKYSEPIQIEPLHEDGQLSAEELTQQDNGTGEAIEMITQRMKSLSSSLNNMPEPPKLAGQQIDIPVMSQPAKKSSK